ncbi:MAG: hypothetical protein EOO65_03315, partial [Methanosarcinales archaeon]
MVPHTSVTMSSIWCRWCVCWGASSATRDSRLLISPCRWLTSAGVFMAAISLLVKLVRVFPATVDTTDAPYDGA